MISLAIVGKADKRVLAYPLMKTLALMGKTIVATDDAAYRRLYPGMENKGMINDVEIHIVKNFSDDSSEEFLSGMKDDNYDYVLYLTEGYVPPDAKKTIALCSPSHTFLGAYLEGLVECSDYSDCVFASLTVIEKPKGYWKAPVTQILWKPEFIQYICETEERRCLMPLKDKTVVPFLCRVFAESLHIDPAKMLKVMKRKLTIGGKA